DVLLDNAAFRIDDKQGGESGDTAVSETNLVGGEGDGVVDAFGVYHLFHGVLVVVVHNQADNPEANLVAILEFDEAGNFRTARATPGGPEIQKDDFAFCRGQREI